MYLPPATTRDASDVAKYVATNFENAAGHPRGLPAAR